MSSWIVLSHWSIGTKFLSAKLWSKALSSPQAPELWPTVTLRQHPARPAPSRGLLRVGWHSLSYSVPSIIPGSHPSLHSWFFPALITSLHQRTSWPKPCAGADLWRMFLPIATVPCPLPLLAINASNKVSPCFGPDSFFICCKVGSEGCCFLLSPSVSCGWN